MLKKIAAPTALALLLINLCCLVWYLFVGYQAGFHSDSAAKVLLAREIVETGNYFPADWNYVNGDLFVLFGHTFVIPLLALMPAGFTAHAISGLISSALILLGVWLVTGLGQIGIAHRLLTVAVVAAGFSGFTAENFFGQVSYGSGLYLTCFTLFVAWQILKVGARKILLWGGALLIVVTLAFWANPQRAFVSYTLPLLAAAGFLLISNNNDARAIDKRLFLVLLGFTGLGVICGIALHIQTVSGVNNVLGAANPHWLPYELIVRNAGLFLKGYFAIFGGLPTADSAVISKVGVYEATRLLTALALLVLMPISIRRVMQRGDPAMIFIAVFALTALSSILFIQLTTTVPDMSDPVQSSRYLVVSLILLILIVLMQPLDFVKSPLLSASHVGLFAVMLTSAYPAFVMSGPNSNMNWGLPGQRSNGHQALADYLVKIGLKYGYGSYWNAGSTSVLSKELALVRPIIIDNGIPMPMRHLSSNRWYRPSTWQGETFLLMTSQEAKLLDLERMATHGVAPTKVKEFGSYIIYVFPENIASKLPGWDTRYEIPVRFEVSKHASSQAGRLYDDYEGAGPALVAEKGVIGALHFGPYVNVEPGRYRATFDVIAAHQTSGVVRLDIAAAPDQMIVGEATLTESHHPQVIDFSLDKTRTMEFRVWALGNERVIFKGVTIQRLQEGQ